MITLHEDFHALGSLMQLVKYLLGVQMFGRKVKKMEQPLCQQHFFCKPYGI
jgi:hypothetical protein